MEIIEEEDCHAYTKGEVFKYNYLIWTIAFFIGL